MSAASSSTFPGPRLEIKVSIRWLVKMELALSSSRGPTTTLPPASHRSRSIASPAPQCPLLQSVCKPFIRSLHPGVSSDLEIIGKSSCFIGSFVPNPGAGGRILVCQVRPGCSNNRDTGRVQGEGSAWEVLSPTHCGGLCHIVFKGPSSFSKA